MRVSREQLHDLVWSMPMTEIDRQFGLRDQHIARACDGAEVARPRAGYWQKVEHGKCVTRMALSNDRYTARDIITIDATGWEILQTQPKSSHDVPARSSRL
jgi:hypothetical protein